MTNQLPAVNIQAAVSQDEGAFPGARFKECADAYIALGWQILPLCYPVDGKCTCGRHESHLKNPQKVPECSPGKSPHFRLGGSSKQGTTDAATVDRWFASGERFNLGIVAGEKSGLVIVDVDIDKGGTDSWNNLTGGTKQETPTVETGSGGGHFYYKHPGTDIRNSAGTIGDGLDLRGHHGYCVAPPSLHPCGKEYRWKIDPRAPMADMPKWVMNGKATAPAIASTEGDDIPEGKRDDYLTRVGGRLRFAGLEAPGIKTELHKINSKRCNPPKDDAEVARIANSVGGYRNGTEFNLTDAGNAELLAAMYNRKLRYIWEQKAWYFYDGTRWSKEKGEAAARQMALEAARYRLVLAAAVDNKTERKKIIAHSFKSESRAAIDNALAVARSLPEFAAYQNQFDQDIYKLNLPNGTVNSKTSRLLPHNPDDMITQLAPVRYPETDAEKECPRWLECLNTWHKGDQETIGYLQRLAGMCLTGDISSRKFPIFLGGGKNGKSVFLDTLMMLLGDYACKAPRTLLRQNFGEAHPTDVAGLVAKRLVVASENEKGMKLNTSLVKEMTGDAVLTARFMRQDYFQFKPTHHTVLMTQNLPAIDETADAIWDRVHKIEWPVRIPPNMQDTHLADKLRAEWPGILYWAVQGCLQWQKDGDLLPTDKIRLQTEQYRNEQNPFNDFVEECCVLGGDLYVRVTELIEYFRSWATISGLDSEFSKINTRDFGELVTGAKFEKTTKKINGQSCKCWIGLGLKSSAEFEDIPI